MLGALGVDVSKSTLHCSLVDKDSRDVCWSLVVSNTPQGIAELLLKTPPDVSVVVEPTGRYSHLIVREAQACGRTVLLAPSRKARYYRMSQQDRAKTDPIDGASLALFGLGTKLRPYVLKSEPVDALGQLLSARRGLADALSRLKQRQAELPEARSIYGPVVAQMKVQLQAADERIQQQLTATPASKTAKAIDEVPGIGPVTSAAVAACLCSKDFVSADAFVAYTGLDVKVRDSGKHKGQRKLTKQGDAELRRLLYLCARASVRVKTSPLRTQFEHECSKGLKKTGAYCSVARKMARLCWSMHKHGTSYDASRVGRQPERNSPDQQEAAGTPAE